MEIKADTPLIYLTVDQLQKLIRSEISKRETGNMATNERGDALIHGFPGLAEYLGCSVPTARKMVELKKFPHIKFGRKFSFRESDIKKILLASK